MDSIAYEVEIGEAFPTDMGTFQLMIRTAIPGAGVCSVWKVVEQEDEEKPLVGEYYVCYETKKGIWDIACRSFDMVPYGMNAVLIGEGRNASDDINAMYDTVYVEDLEKPDKVQMLDVMITLEVPGSIADNPDEVKNVLEDIYRVLEENACAYTVGQDIAVKKHSN